MLKTRYPGLVQFQGGSAEYELEESENAFLGWGWNLLCISLTASYLILVSVRILSAVCNERCPLHEEGVCFFSYSKKSKGIPKKAQEIFITSKTLRLHLCPLYNEAFILTFILMLSRYLLLPLLQITQEKGKHLPTQKLYTNVHRSIIYNSQQLKITQASFDNWMVKQTVVQPYLGMLLGNKKEWTHKILRWISIK